MAKHLLVFLLLLLLSISARSQEWQWVTQAGGNYTESSQLAVDAQGSSYTGAKGHVVGAASVSALGANYAKSIAATSVGRSNVADFGGNMSRAGDNERGSNLFSAQLRSVSMAATPTITVGTLPASYSTCSGTTLDIPFTTTGTFQTGNTFQALLSDKNGSFVAPTLIGQGAASPIKTTIPSGVEAGAGYKIMVIATSPYTASEASAKSIELITVPIPGAMVGNTAPCVGETGLTYAIPAQPGAIAYDWKLPVGWSFLEGPGSPSIKVKAGAQSGNIAVTVTTACGTSAVTTLYVSVDNTVPSQPAAIVASKTEVCPGMEVTYSIAPEASATGYTWTVPHDWSITSGQGTSSITAIVGVNAGMVSVAAFNQCGVSAAQTLNVSAGPPAAPTVVAATGCVGSSVTLQASGAWTEYAYYWYTSATGGDYIAKGASFTTPPLKATTTYYVSLVAKGGCESPRTAVTATITPEQMAEAGPDETVCAGAPAFTLAGYAPAGGVWAGAGVTASGEFNPSMAGAGVHTLTYSMPPNSCFASATKTITVTPEPVLTLLPFEDVCSIIHDFDLSKGQPVGGTYSGIGVDSTRFDATVAGVGTHTITYTYNFDGGCKVSTTQTITVTTCTGLPESKLASQLILYPNPTQAEIRVALPLPKATSLTLRLSDTKGQQVYERHFGKMQGDFKHMIDLSARPKGIYLLQLVLNDGVITRRVLKD